MARVDLRKLALRLKVLEMMRAYWECRAQSEAGASWRRLILPN